MNRTLIIGWLLMLSQIVPQILTAQELLWLPKEDAQDFQDVHAAFRGTFILPEDAEKNIAAFEQFKTQEGISAEAGWAFVDWGYVPNDGETDMGLNLIYYDAIRAMIAWSEALGLDRKVDHYAKLAADMADTIESPVRLELIMEDPAKAGKTKRLVINKSRTIVLPIA